MVELTDPVVVLWLTDDCVPVNVLANKEMLDHPKLIDPVFELLEPP